MVVPWVRSPATPTSQVRATADNAPMKAAICTPSNAPLPSPKSLTKARVAPRPPPAAMPSRYGSASGLRKTPWYVPPAVASEAPTSRPSTTRGNRRFHTIACWVSLSPESIVNGVSRSSVSRSVPPTGIDVGPTNNASDAAPMTNATPAASQSGLAVVGVAFIGIPIGCQLAWR